MSKNHPNRRTILTGAIATGAFGFAAIELVAQTRPPRATALKPGEYLWHPELAPDGPVAIVVSLPDQLVHVYRNGVRIGLSTCSSGKPGHRTPTGVFTILQKDAHHHSSTYNNAPMPNMNRLTWSGVALHAGDLPGYPASHGCIRLPLQFSRLLFTVTHIGTAVIVADDHTQPKDVAHPGAVLSALAADEMAVAVAQLAEKKLPKPDHGYDVAHAVSMVISRADSELTVVKNGEITAKGKVFIDRPNEPFGSHAFVLVTQTDEKRSLRWMSVGYRTSGALVELNDPDAALIGRVQSEEKLAREVAGLMHPGLVMVLTDLPAHPDTRTTKDFVVVTGEG